MSSPQLLALVRQIGALGLDDAAQRPHGDGDVVGSHVRANGPRGLGSPQQFGRSAPQLLHQCRGREFAPDRCGQTGLPREFDADRAQEDVQSRVRRGLLGLGGDVACAMEVSSHALELGRADAIHFAAAIFTNLTQDHLDFHPTLEDYFLAKRRLFAAEPGVAVVNVDDPYGRRLANELGGREGVLTFAIDRDASYRAVDVESGFAGSSFTALTPEGPVALRTPLPGRFNVQNVLGAVAAVRALGVPLADIAAALPQAGRVPGRFEPVDEGQPFAVLVDYAHTPDSLENVLSAARPLTQGRLWCVFGCGGDRDRGKRPLMGEIVARLADRTIVTSDNPRSEEPEAILEEILAGIPAERRDGVATEVDRRRAIAAALAQADAGDVVVIAGKGHEQGQELEQGRKLPFDDVTVAREALRAAAEAAAR